MSKQMVDTINIIKEEEGFVSFAETQRHLLMIGIAKMRPKYMQRHSTTPIEERVEEENLADKVEQMGAKRVDKMGNPDPEGGYLIYKSYTLVPGNPPKLGIVEEKNPVSMIDNLIENQFTGGTKTEIENIIKSNNYIEIK